MAQRSIVACARGPPNGMTSSPPTSKSTSSTTLNTVWSTCRAGTCMAQATNQAIRSRSPSASSDIRAVDVHSACTATVRST